MATIGEMMVWVGEMLFIAALFACYLFFVVLSFRSSVAFWDALLNYRKKKKLLDDYAENGVEALAIVTHQSIVLKSKTGRRTHRMIYVYREPGGGASKNTSPCIVKKNYAHEYEGHAADCLQGPVVEIKVLPDHPRSGFPNFRIHRREVEYGPTARQFRTQISFLLLFISILVQPVFLLILAEEFFWDLDAFVIVSGIPSLPVYLLLGLFAACFSYSKWNWDLLGYCPVPAAAEEPSNGTAPSSVQQQGSVPVFARKHVNVDGLTDLHLTEEGVAQGTTWNWNLLGYSRVPSTEPAKSPRANTVPLLDQTSPEGGGGDMRLDQPQKGQCRTIPDPLGQVIVEEARNRHCTTLLNELNGGNFRTGAWDARAHYVGLAALAWTGPRMVSSASLLFPDTAPGNLLKGALTIGLYAHALLRAAEQDPEDPTPYALLAGSVANGMKLEVEPEQARAWFEAAIIRDPCNALAHASRLYGLSPMWAAGGSDEQMYSFARETAAKAPSGSLLKVVVLMAFYEHWSYLALVEGDRREAQRRLLQNRPVREETVAVYRDAIENREIGQASECVPHAAATLWLLVLNEKDAAERELAKLRPWRDHLAALGDKYRLLLLAWDDPDLAQQFVHSVHST